MNPTSGATDVFSKKLFSKISDYRHKLLLETPGCIFPQLANGLPVPNGTEVREPSRYTLMGFNNKTILASVQFSSPVAIRLLRRSIGCATGRGAKRLYRIKNDKSASKALEIATRNPRNISYLIN